MAMRFPHVLFAALLVSSSGCSMLIAASGKDVEKLTTREAVRQEFGQPTATDGSRIDEYHTRRKLAEPDIALAGRNMGLAMTYGLAEFICFPCEVYQLGRHTLLGQDLRFTYDAHGSVTAIYVDGEILHTGVRRTTDAAQAPTARAKN
jgi:hypothetical protein